MISLVLVYICRRDKSLLMKLFKKLSHSILLLFTFTVPSSLHAQQKDTVEITPKGYPFILSVKGIRLYTKTSYSNFDYPSDTTLNKTVLDDYDSDISDSIN